jgi:hypothetical protein
MRGLALISAALLSLFATVVTVRAGLLLPEGQPLSRTLVWGVVGYCAIGVVANTLTPSRSERRLWLPVVIAMLGCSVVVATS